MIDLILYNGNIHTLSHTHGTVQALAIAGDRIVAVGDNLSVLELAGPKTIKHSLQGLTVIPGLTDAHVHWEWTARGMHSVDVETSTKEEALQRVAEYAAEHQADEWITGRGWAQDFWPDREFPTATDLDSVVADRPVFLQAKSGHAAWVNSAALKLAGISASMPDPEGGQIIRDQEGNPTGILLENAIGLVADLVPSVSPERLAEMMVIAQERAHRAGLTGLHDFDDPSCLRALQIMRERGQLGLRIVKQINKDFLSAALGSGLHSGFGDDWLRIGNLKLFSDGALGPRTALMTEPYENEPDNYGISVLDKETMVELASQASRAGLATTIHAIGDKAVHDVLDAFEIVRQEEMAAGIRPSERRHRIEHVQIIHPDDKHRLAELNIIASMQPIHATSDWKVADRWWGKRSEWAYNPRLQLDQHVHIAFGSDSPIEPIEPILGIHAAVTRQDKENQPDGGWYPDARLTVDETLRGFTKGPAYAAGMEDRLGQLTHGYYADLVVLDKDPYTVEPQALRDLQVLGTMVGGTWRYGELDNMKRRTS
ncbi:MAG: amidohydrolase [Anaerolineaceae bacterium]|nr:amidohydrolase [Anaerolineaceae bacterium]